MHTLVKSSIALPAVIALVLAFGVCEPMGEEPATVVFPVQVSGEDLAICTSDLGWEISLSNFRMVVRNLEFTIEGEIHEASWRGVSDLLVPEVMAHPGHYAGGEVTGEMPGRYVIDLLDSGPQPLGEASLLEGQYNGFNLYFATGLATDGLDAGDSLLGHSALIGGSAEREGVEVEFEAMIDIEEGTQMVGGLMDFEVGSGSTGTLLMKVMTVDPTEGDTLFDGIDFGSLEGETPVAILPGEECHNILMKALQVHDHFEMEVQP